MKKSINNKVFPALFLFFFFLLLFSFSFSSSFERCNSDSDCPYWETCKWGFCIVNKDAGYCDNNYSCEYYEFCNLSTHRCALEPGACRTDKDCEYWQKCDSFFNTCKPKEGFCEDASDCPWFAYCDLGTHMCMKESDAPEDACLRDSDCGKFGECISNKCVIEPVSCKEDKDCPVGTCFLGKCSAHLRDNDKKIAIAMIFDDSGSMAGSKMETAKRLLVDFLKKLDLKGVSIALYSFDGCSGEQDIPFTEDRDRIAKVALSLSPSESTPLVNTIDLALKDLEKRDEDFRFVVLFTDGEEVCSSLSPCSFLALRNKTFPIFPVGYVLGPGEIGSLKCIADITGGQYLNSPKEENLADVFDDIIEVINNDLCDLGINPKNLDGPIYLNPSFLEEGGCPLGKYCDATTHMCKKPRFNILFMPIGKKNFLDDLNSFKPPKKALVEKIAEDQVKKFTEVIPGFENCSYEVGYAVADEPCHIPRDAIDKPSLAFEYLDLCALMNGFLPGSYDRIVGVVDDDSHRWLGYTLINNTHIILTVRSASYPIVLSHELGHTFGLFDEYCSCPGYCNMEPNPLKEEYGCNPEPGEGCCISDFRIFGITIIDRCPDPYPGCHICCKGNKNKEGGRSIMSYANAEKPRYFDGPSLEHLKKFDILRCENEK